MVVADVSLLACLYVPSLAMQSSCPIYDCEYVALAEHLDVTLVSGDTKLIRAVPGRLIALSQ